jgi:hypothetical protein
MRNNFFFIIIGLFECCILIQVWDLIVIYVNFNSNVVKKIKNFNSNGLSTGKKIERW